MSLPVALAFTDERRRSVSTAEDLAAIARRVVDANIYMTLGTVDEGGLPWVSPVWFAHAEYREFFWVSRPDARHSRNLAVRPQVALVIFDSHEPGTWRSLYMSALATEVQGAAVDEGIEIFSRRSTKRGLPEWSRKDVQPPARHRLYRAAASEHFVLDPRDERRPVGLG
jgi:nitroimidazol reductase NimA-like FMN-containing flavoprotein (pyridoxamine 5'-phosphate oxidase superfamily)